MITIEQLKDIKERTEALHRYLDIDGKKIQVEEEQLRTQAPGFWDDQKAAEAQMKKVKSLQQWISGYQEVKTLADELQLSFDFYKDELVMEEEVDEYLAQKMEQVPDDTHYELQFSAQSNLLFQNAYAFVESSNAEVLDIPHVVQAMLLLPDSWACYFLKKHLKERIPDFISQLVVIYGDDLSLEENDSEESHGPWKNFVTCLNEQLEPHNPLIGHRNWNGPSKYCAGKKKTIRCTSVNQAWEKQRWPTDWPPASRPERCLND